MAAISKYRHPRSTCILWSTWDSQVTRWAKGTKPTERTLGYVSIRFRKGRPHVYQLTRRMTYGMFQKWMGNSSPGRFWNRNLKGRY